MAGRLYDKMRTRHPVDLLSRQIPPPDLGGGEIFLITNVADYYLDFLPKAFRTGDQYTVPWDYEKHYPFCAPPFEEMWFEFDTTKIYDVDRIGVKIQAVELTQTWLDDQAEVFVESLGGSPMDTARWLLFMEGYVEYSNGNLTGPVATYVIGVAPDGSIARRSDDDTFMYSVKTYNLTLAHGMQPFIVNPCLMAMSFMHTKNTRQLEVVPELPRTKNQRKKDHKHPASTYYVLKIDPVDQVVASRRLGNRATPEEHTPAALHVVRGHFADHREHGLFGKYPGIYWVSSHIRGNVEGGAVEKDYEVVSPKKP